MKCSLSRFYTLIASAIFLLGVAIAFSFIPLDVFGLSISIAAVLIVSFNLIPAMRDELRAYDECMGPSRKCGSVSRSIDILGQAASAISVISFAAALALSISAIAAYASIILSWLGVGLTATAEALKISGRISCGIGIGILTGLLTMVAQYQSCRERELSDRTPGTNQGGLSSTPLNTGQSTEKTL